MGSLKETLGQPGKRPQVIADSERVIEEEVDSKGLLGLPIKAAYKIVKAIKPGFVPEVIDHMLDDFCDKLDPLYQAAAAKNEPVTAYFNARPGEVSDALLSITDGRAQRSSNQGLKSAYEKLRPLAKKQVEAAVPRVSRMIAKHTAPAPTT